MLRILETIAKNRNIINLSSMVSTLLKGGLRGLFDLKESRLGGIKVGRALSQPFDFPA